MLFRSGECFDLAQAGAFVGERGLGTGQARQLEDDPKHFAGETSPVESNLLQQARRGTQSALDDAKTAPGIVISQMIDQPTKRQGFLVIRRRAMAQGDADIREVLHRSFAAYRDFLSSLLQRCRPHEALPRGLDLGAATWTMLAVGFTLNVTSLLGFQDDLGRTTLEGLVEALARTFLDHPGTLDPLAERISEP